MGRFRRLHALLPPIPFSLTAAPHCISLHQLWGFEGSQGQVYSLQLVLFTTDPSYCKPSRDIKAAALSEQQGALAILGPLERVKKSCYLCVAASKVTLLEARPAFPPVKPNARRGAAMRLL